MEYIGSYQAFWVYPHHWIDLDVRNRQGPFCLAIAALTWQNTFFIRTVDLHRPSNNTKRLLDLLEHHFATPVRKGVDHAT